MNAAMTSWEHHLATLAQQEPESDAAISVAEPERELLARAYDYCDGIANNSGRTFYLASRLLPEEKRRAVRALYAFCRVTDDLIDRSAGDLEEGLAAWRSCTMTFPPPCDNPVAVAWADTRIRYRIPARYAEQLVHGVAADLQKKRYASFEELTVYCYGVASTVGLMSMHIVGYSGREAIPYAIKLGVAMQLTNILRDVPEDYAAGRIYLPQDELAAFGLSDKDIAAGCNDERWQRFMQFQIARNRQLYAEALPGVAELLPAGRYAVAAAAELYRALLDDIEQHDYDVFRHRAHLSTFGKLRRLPAAWLRAHRGEYADLQVESFGGLGGEMTGQLTHSSVR